MPMSLAARARQLVAMMRALPEITSWQPSAATMAVSAALLVTAHSPSAAQSRIRFGAALVAASLALVVDDPAAATLAADPTTLRWRRGVRVLVAVGALALWWLVASVLADARTGSGRPPIAVGLESAAVMAVGLGVAAMAASRVADGAGPAGSAAALALFGASFLPSQWWIPLAPDPSTGQGPARIAWVSAVAVVVLFAASIDPAGRRWPVVRRST